LQTVVEVAAEKNSTLVLPFPVELLRFLERSTPAQTAAPDSTADPDDTAEQDNNAELESHSAAGELESPGSADLGSGSSRTAADPDPTIGASGTGIRSMG
jgi:hypothetical protein